MDIPVRLTLVLSKSFSGTNFPLIQDVNHVNHDLTL